MSDTFPQFLNDWIDKEGLTLGDAARLIGVSYPTFHKWRKDGRLPDGTMQANIAQAMNVDLTVVQEAVGKGSTGSLAARVKALETNDREQNATIADLIDAVQTLTQAALQPAKPAQNRGKTTQTPPQAKKHKR